jgi:DNA-binding transcriptional ArsR family regulator
MADGTTFESALVKALGHPLRLRLLEEILDQGEASPSGLARKLGKSLSTISRHVRMLRDLGFVELTRIEPRRGAVEHFYRATQLAVIDDEQWAELPVALRRGLVGQTFRKIFAEAAAAAAVGGFDAREAHMDRVPLWLDARGMRELSAALRSLVQRTEEIQLASDARKGAASRSCAVLLHFTNAPSPTAGDPADRRQLAPRPRLP